MSAFYKLKIRALDLFDRSFIAPEFTEKPILIAGNTRGGTTWLMENLYQPQFKIVWEPTRYNSLNEFSYEGFNKDLGIVPYIPENAEWDEAFKYFKLLLSGKIRSPFHALTHPLMLHDLTQKNRLLIKCCNINALLPWLTNHFDIKPILLLRQPYGVIASQMVNPGFSIFNHRFDLLKNDTPKFNQNHLKFARQIEAIDSKISLLANWWALHHTDVLNHPFRDKKWITVSYENLVKNPLTELKNLYDVTGIKSTPLLKNIYQPSTTSFGNETNYLDKWKERLSPSDIKTITRILESYEIDLNQIPDLK